MVELEVGVAAAAALAVHGESSSSVSCPSDPAPELCSRHWRGPKLRYVKGALCLRISHTGFLDLVSCWLLLVFFVALEGQRCSEQSSGRCCWTRGWAFLGASRGGVAPVGLPVAQLLGLPAGNVVGLPLALSEAQTVGHPVLVISLDIQWVSRGWDEQWGRQWDVRWRQSSSMLFELEVGAAGAAKPIENPPPQSPVVPIPAAELCSRQWQWPKRCNYVKGALRLMIGPTGFRDLVSDWLPLVFFIALEGQRCSEQSSGRSRGWAFPRDFPGGAPVGTSRGRPADAACWKCGGPSSCTLRG